MSDFEQGACMFFGVAFVVIGAVAGSRVGFNAMNYIEIAVGTGLGLVGMLHK